MILLLMMLGLISCQSNEEKETVNGFDKYCENYCVAAGMQKSDDTVVEDYTLNCLCEKIFLRTEWVKENE